MLVYSFWKLVETPHLETSHWHVIWIDSVTRKLSIVQGLLLSRWEPHYCFLSPITAGNTFKFEITLMYDFTYVYTSHRMCWQAHWRGVGELLARTLCYKPARWVNNCISAHVVVRLEVDESERAVSPPKPPTSLYWGDCGVGEELNSPLPVWCMPQKGSLLTHSNKLEWERELLLLAEDAGWAGDLGPETVVYAEMVSDSVSGTREMKMTDDTSTVVVVSPCRCKEGLFQSVTVTPET